MTQAEFQTIHHIAGEDLVYRNVHIMQMQRIEGKRVPSEAQFSADPDGMSVNWNQKINPEQCMHVLGIRHNRNGNFIDISGFRIFALPKDFLLNTAGASAVSHSPSFNGDPAPIGNPNNIAHASVMHDNDVEVRLKMATYCQDNYKECHCTPDLDSCQKTIEELKATGDNNAWHRLDMM